LAAFCGVQPIALPRPFSGHLSSGQFRGGQASCAIDGHGWSRCWAQPLSALCQHKSKVDIESLQTRENIPS
jgi:hypothetical protein